MRLPSRILRQMAGCLPSSIAKLLISLFITSLISSRPSSEPPAKRICVESLGICWVVFPTWRSSVGQEGRGFGRGSVFLLCCSNVGMQTGNGAVVPLTLTWLASHCISAAYQCLPSSHLAQAQALWERQGFFLSFALLYRRELRFLPS